MKLGQYTIIAFFVLITAGLSVYSWVGHFDESENNSAEKSSEPVKNKDSDESYFKVVDYYLLDGGKPFLQLEASELTISAQNTVVIGFNPNGVIYRRNQKGLEEEPIFFSAKNSRGLMTNKELYLEDTVDVKVGTSNLKSDKMNIYNGGKHMEATGNVKTNSLDAKTKDQLSITSDFAVYRPEQEFFEYQKNVRGLVQRARQYEENVTFRTDLLTLSAPESLVEMKGNVAFKKGNLDASSNKGTVFLENYNKKLKYYSLSDDVRLQETLTMDGKPLVRKAFAEKLEGFISEKRVVLTGLPKVFQGRDVIKGNRIIIRENIETVEVDDANTNITLEREKEKL